MSSQYAYSGSSLLNLLLPALLVAPSAQGCTDFQLRYPITNNETTSYTVSARTIDWGKPDVNPKLHTVPVGENVQLLSGKGCNTTTTNTTAAFGFVYADVMNNARPAVDGMNVAGLSGAVLELKSKYGTVYPSYVKDDPRPVLAVYSLVTYMLAVCDTIACVKSKIQAHQIVDGEMAELEVMGGSYGSHLQFHDRAGKSLVVEYIGQNFSSSAPVCFNSTDAMHKYAKQAGARVCMYDNNDLKVMTNQPLWEEMRANLTGRLNGTEYEDIASVPNLTISEVLRTAGGFTPSNRLAHVAMLQELAVRNDGQWVLGKKNEDLSFVHLSNTTTSPDDLGDDHVSAATVMIGRVSVAKGLLENDAVGQQDWTTSHTSIRDHVRGRYYFNTPAIRNMRMVDLNKLRLGEDDGSRRAVGRRLFPLAQPVGPKYEDLSSVLLEKTEGDDDY